MEPDLLPSLCSAPCTVTERSLKLADRDPAVHLCVKYDIVFVGWIQQEQTRGARQSTAQLAGSPTVYAAGCSRIAAKARSRFESAGFLAVPASFSNAGARRFNFASSSLLMCEVSAL